MSTAALAQPVLADRIPLAGRMHQAVVRDVALVVGLAALTALAAQLRVPVPFSPVPITGQTLVVLLGAAAVGPLRAVTAQGLYVAVGVAGAPVFTGWAGGIEHALGVTGGYLVGFVLASFVVGALARRGLDRRPGGTLVAFAAGTATIYAVAVPWFAVVTSAGAAAAAWQAAGVFVVGDVVKAVIAAGLLPAAWWLSER